MFSMYVKYSCWGFTSLGITLLFLTYKLNSMHIMFNVPKTYVMLLMYQHYCTYHGFAYYSVVNLLRMLPCLWILYQTWSLLWDSTESSSFWFVVCVIHRVNNIIKSMDYIYNKLSLWCNRSIDHVQILFQSLSFVKLFMM